MSVRVFIFLTEWLRQNVVNRVATVADVERLAARCIRDAQSNGITTAELERDVGSVKLCIRKALKYVG
jgi:cytosine/adenosine deaminase-related metal-dependent hydrolase